MFNGTYSGSWAPNFRLVNNGDAADQNTFNTCYQDALDRTAYLKEATAGLGTSPVHLRSDDGANITVNAQAACALTSRVVALPIAQTFDAAAKAGVANLSFNTWYYIYAIYNGGWDILVSAEVPKSNLRYSLTSNDQMYLGCFRSNSVGDVVPFIAHRGHYNYDVQNEAPHNLRVLDAGNAVAMTDVVCQKAVPPHVRMVEVYVLLNNTLAALHRVDLRRKGDAATNNMRLYAAGIANTISTGCFWINTDSAQTFQYAVDDNNNAASIWVKGFQE